VTWCCSASCATDAAILGVSSSSLRFLEDSDMMVMILTVLLLCVRFLQQNRSDFEMRFTISWMAEAQISELLDFARSTLRSSRSLFPLRCNTATKRMSRTPVASSSKDTMQESFRSTDCFQHTRTRKDTLQSTPPRGTVYFGWLLRALRATMPTPQKLPTTLEEYVEPVSSYVARLFLQIKHQHAPDERTTAGNNSFVGRAREPQAARACAVGGVDSRIVESYFIKKMCIGSWVAKNSVCITVILMY